MVKHGTNMVVFSELEEPGYDEDPDETILLGIMLLAKSSHVKDTTVYTYGNKKSQFKTFKVNPDSPSNRLFTLFGTAAGQFDI